MNWVWISLAALFSIAVLYRHVPQMIFLIKSYRHYREKTHDLHGLGALCEVVDFAKKYYDLAPSIENDVNNMKDHFLRESLQTFLTGTVRGHELLRGLRRKADEKYEEELRNAQKIKATAKFLPVIGWIVALGAALWTFSTGHEGAYLEYASRAFAFVVASVFYGLGVIYFVLEPTLDRVEKTAFSERVKNILIVEAISHLMKKQSAYEMFEAINVSLPPSAKLKFAQFFSDYEQAA